MKPPKKEAYWHVMVTRGHASVQEDGPSNMRNQLARGDDMELFVGPHTRLAGFNGAAYIESEALAKAFAEAILPTVRKRKGKFAELRVEAVHSLQGGISPSDQKKIDEHSEIIRKRIDANNFVPNSKVGLED